MSLKSLLNQWPAKLGALLMGSLVWFFVSLGNDTVGQSTLSVPVTVEGLEANQTPIGVPETVSVVASGRSNRVTRLRPENFDASLDLTGVSGAFQETITVVAPQGITVESVTPARASGTVEIIVSETVPIQVGLLGEGPADAVLRSRSTPAEVTVRGRGSLLERLSAVRALVPAQPGEHPAALFAVDVDGLPIDDLALEPPRATVAVEETPVLHTKDLRVEVEPFALEGFAVEGFELLDGTLRVAGPAEALAALGAVSAAVEPATLPTEAGEYTLAVAPRLPEGVAALSDARVRFRLVAPEDPADGDVDDLPSAPLRRPRSTQDSQPGDPLR